MHSLSMTEPASVTTSPASVGSDSSHASPCLLPKIRTRLAATSAANADLSARLLQGRLDDLGQIECRLVLATVRGARSFLVVLHLMMMVVARGTLLLSLGLQFGHLPRLRSLAELVRQSIQALGLGPRNV